MSGSKSKNKGNTWERTVAKFLSDLYSESFIRTPGSGAFIGGLNSVRKQVLSESQIKNFKGDIIAPESWKKFNCEAKSYADFPFHQLYQTSVPILEKWIEQMFEVADPGDFNVIIMKFNRKGSYVAIQPTPSLIPNKNHFIYQSVKRGTWIIQDFESFWTANSQSIKQLCI